MCWYHLGPFPSSRTSRSPGSFTLKHTRIIFSWRRATQNKDWAHLMRRGRAWALRYGRCKRWARPHLPLAWVSRGRTHTGALCYGIMCLGRLFWSEVGPNRPVILGICSDSVCARRRIAASPPATLPCASPEPRKPLSDVLGWPPTPALPTCAPAPSPVPENLELLWWKALNSDAHRVYLSCPPTFLTGSIDVTLARQRACV